MYICKKELERGIAFTIIFFALFGFLCFLIPYSKKTILFYGTCIWNACFLTAVGQLFLKNNKQGCSIICLFLAFCLLAFLLGFRNGTAVDDPSYRIYFSRSYTYGWLRASQISNDEPGYFILLSIIGKFTKDYIYVQLATAIIPLLLIFCTMVHECKLISWPVALFLFITGFFFEMISINLSRMFFALSVVACSIPYLLDKKTKNYIFCIMIASLFHYSALIMLPFVYLTANERNSKIYRCFTMSFFASMPLIVFFTIRFVIPHTRYFAYSQTYLNFNGIIRSLTRVPLYLVMAVGKKYVVDKEVRKKITLMQDIFIFAISIKLCGTFASIARLTYYFDLFFYFGAAMLYKNVKNNTIKLFLILFLCTYGIIYLNSTQFALPLQASSLFPYKNIWFII